MKEPKLIKLQDLLAEKWEALARENARARGYTYERQADGSYTRVPYREAEANG